jgi:hypothetical protein
MAQIVQSIPSEPIVPLAVMPASVKIGNLYKIVGKRLRDKRRYSQAPDYKVRKSTITYCNYCKKIPSDCDPEIKFAHKVYHFYVTEFVRTLAVRFDEATSKNVKAAMMMALHICKCNEVVDILTSTETHIICSEAGLEDVTIGLEIKHESRNGVPDTIMKMTYNGIGASISVYKSLYCL